MYVYLEGTWHPMGENEHTVCGIVVPHGTEWVRQVPGGADVHCLTGDPADYQGQPTTRTDTAGLAPKAKARKKG